MSKDLSKEILARIDTWCQEELQDKKRRTHLGASLIGDPCSRKLWYNFRWVSQENFGGRQIRLFNRGHLEEARFVQYLRGIGCIVADEDPATGGQFRVSEVRGHFGGSCDGQAILPPDFNYDKPVLLEFKTANDRSYKDMLKKGVERSKPVHKSQMDLYGYLLGLEWALYMVVNKNDDALYAEMVKLDPANGAELVEKARDVIDNNLPPQRAFPVSHQGCNWCPYVPHCHFGKPFDVNCRSCAHAIPVDGAKWFCNAHNQGPIPDEVIAVGCPSYQPLSNL